MSVELRWDYDSGEVDCCWGVIEHSDPRPDRDEVGHLMLTTRSYIEKILEDPRPLKAPSSRALHQVTSDGGRIFAHIHYFGKKWTWELFEAHFSDGKGPDDILIGRWPD